MTTVLVRGRIIIVLLVFCLLIYYSQSTIAFDVSFDNSYFSIQFDSIDSEGVPIEVQVQVQEFDRIEYNII